MWRLIRGWLAGLGLLVVVVTATPLVRWWGRTLAGPWNDPRGDVLIVLGGSILGDGTIGVSSYWRSVYAARVYREGWVRAVVVTGGGKQGTPIAVPMRDLMVFLGIPASIIRVETASSSTRENALFTRAMVQDEPGRKVLLTSDYQMFRAYRAFRAAGLEVLPRPIPDLAKTANCWQCRWSAFSTLVLETTKIGYYSLRGWL